MFTSSKRHLAEELQTRSPIPLPLLEIVPELKSLLDWLSQEPSSTSKEAQATHMPSFDSPWGHKLFLYCTKKQLEKIQKTFEKKQQIANKFFNKEEFLAIQQKFLDRLNTLQQQMASSEETTSLDESQIESLTAQVTAYLEQQYNIQIREKMVGEAKKYLKYLKTKIHEPSSGLTLTEDETEAFLASNDFKHYEQKKKEYRQKIQKKEHLKSEQQEQEKSIQYDQAQLASSKKSLEELYADLESLEPKMKEKTENHSRSKNQLIFIKNEISQRPFRHAVFMAKNNELSEKLYSLKTRQYKTESSIKTGNTLDTTSSKESTEDIPSLILKIKARIIEIEKLFKKNESVINDYFNCENAINEKIGTTSEKTKEQPDRAVKENLTRNISRLESLIMQKKLDSVAEIGESLVNMTTQAASATFNFFKKFTNNKPEQPNDSSIQPVFIGKTQSALRTMIKGTAPKNPSEALSSKEADSTSLNEPHKEITIEELESELTLLKKTLEALENNETETSDVLQILARTKDKKTKELAQIWDETKKIIGKKSKKSEEEKASSISEKKIDLDKKISRITQNDQEIENLQEEKEVIIKNLSSLKQEIIAKLNQKLNRQEEKLKKIIQEHENEKKEISSKIKITEDEINALQDCFEKHESELDIQLNLAEEEFKKTSSSLDEIHQQEQAIRNGISINKGKLNLSLKGVTDGTEAINKILEETKKVSSEIKDCQMEISKSRQVCKSALAKKPESFVLFEKFSFTQGLIYALENPAPDLSLEDIYNSLDGVRQQLSKHREELRLWLENQVPFLAHFLPSKGRQVVDMMDRLASAAISTHHLELEPPQSRSSSSTEITIPS